MPVNTPSDVVDPVATVAAAENEALCLDILVCGNCQSVFHFSEEFQEHKLRNDCEKADKSIVNQQQNTKKPQVWAFLIWKNSQQKADDQQGSWKLYQKWCNMPDGQRQSWVTAGRNIQTFINLSHARELNKTDCIFNKEVDQSIEDDIEEDFAVEKVVGKRYNQKKRQVEYLLKWEGYPGEQNTWEPLSNLTTCKSLLQDYERSLAQNDRGFNSRLSGVLKRDSTLSPVKLPNTNAIKPAGVIPNKFSLIEKKNEVLTPTLSLQTQRKIVPVTPLSNSVTPSKLTTPLISALRSDLQKTIDTGRLVNSVDTSNDVSKLPKSPLNSTPLKKRLLSNSEATITPPAVSPEKLPPPEKLKVAEKSKVSEKTKEWCVSIDDDEPVAIKRLSDTPTSDAAENAKRMKMTETCNEEAKKEDETIEIPKSGIFKKSDLKEKYPSINNMFGKANENGDSKSEVPKNGENLRGILKVDHGQMPDLVSGVYRMSVKAGIVKIDSLAVDKQLTATLPAMPGPKGGVLILGSKFDVSKIVKNPVPKSPQSIDRMNVTKAESPALRGIIPKHKLDDSPTKGLKPDFNSKMLSTPDSMKKQVNSSLRKVLGNTVPSRKGKPSLSSPTGGLSRFKPTYIKSQGDTYSDSSSKLGDGDGLQLEFNDFENSDAEEYTLPDDFPEEIDMEPLSPGRPLTLDPETGKRLMRAEGEPTPLPTPEPSPEPSPVPSPIPPQMICKEENEALAGSDNIILKTDETGEGTFAEINGNTYKVTSTDQVGLLQNATFAQGDAVPVTNLTDEEGNETGMLTITGDDGLVYQVANAKLEGDTIVVASGEDEQQCVFVTDDGHQVMQRTNEDGSTVLTLGSAFGDAVAQLVPNQVNILPDGSQIYVKQEDNGQVELVQIQGSEMAEGEGGEQEEQQIDASDENSGQVVAQLIEASEPTPGGGPRRVVLLLPDGNLMVTEVDEEQFAALELEK